MSLPTQPSNLSTSHRHRALRPGLAAVVALTALAAGCASPGPEVEEINAAEQRHPWIVVGVDGGERRVIEDLWGRGELPHLRELAERGVFTDLRTRYTASPVIWTTIATGMRPEEHGITDFVVPTESGDVPVASSLRRVPAIWNMASFAGRSVAVLGWWASWPAEEVLGLVVTDRVLLDVPDRLSPEQIRPDVDREINEVRGNAEGGKNPFTVPGKDHAANALQDWLMARLAQDLANGDSPLLAGKLGPPELLLVYLRGVDLMSHRHWKHYQPEEFPNLDLSAKDLAAFQEAVPDQYRAVDRTVGDLLAAAREGGREPNLLVISDHGFRAAKEEFVQALVDLDRILERLGYLRRTATGEVDLQASEVYSFSSPDFHRRRWLRFGGDVAGSAQRKRIQRRLEKDLERFSFGGGSWALRLAEVRPRERQDGADLAVGVNLPAVTDEIFLDGQPLPGLISGISRISGTHSESTDGIFFAAGPDVSPGAPVDGIRIHDVTPTLLFGLGLPVAEDFAGRPWPELFTDDFRKSHPLRTVATWRPADAPEEGTLTRSGADQELVEELRALGYLQ